MKVISFASAKGGVGKSTLTINTACAAAAEGATVAVLDCDPQATAVLWRKQRDKRVSADEPPTVLAWDAARLGEAIDKLKRQRVRFAFIDLPGRDTALVTAALKVCDLVLVPSRASMVDLAPAHETISAAMRLGVSYCYVMNLLNARATTTTNSVVEHLEQAGLPVAPVHMHERLAYVHAFAAGQGVSEYQPAGAAASEVLRLWTWIKGEL